LNSKISDLKSLVEKITKETIEELRGLEGVR
jgi:hypothetical protein